jgi:DNA repair exonuclease SbcCD ATPase subunit
MIDHSLRYELNEKLSPISDELASIRQDLEELTSKMDNIVGLPKEIDHALERIRKIEKHLGIHTDISA